MASPQLKSFMVYNPTYGPKEGQEHLKIMYYYPESENPDVKINNIGLCEALVQFAMTFNPSKQCESLHTQKERQVFYEPEKNFWFIMTVSSPWKNVLQNGKSVKEYLENELSDLVVDTVLRRAYKMFKLFFGSLQETCSREGVHVLQAKLKSFYEKYLQDIKVGSMDIIHVFNGVEYFKSNKTTYLKIKSFLNSLTCDFPEIKYTVLMNDDKLIWSGLDRIDTHIVYDYLANKVLPNSSSFEDEIDCSYITHDGSCGQFLVGQYSRHSGEPHVTDAFLHDNGELHRTFMVTYKALDVTIAIFVSEDSPPTTDTLRRMDSALGHTLAEFSTVLESFTQKKFDSVEQVYKFVYFNRGNLSVQSSFHHREKSAARKQAVPHGVMQAVLTIAQEITSKSQSSEVISKTTSDHWVAAKKLNGRHECYIITDQKNVNLIDVNEEIRKIYQHHISDVLVSD